MGKNAMHEAKMHIACPNCHAVYDVPESKLDTVLSLRCQACNHSWPLGTTKPAQKAAGQAGYRQSAGGPSSGTARQPQPEADAARTAETTNQSGGEQQPGSVSSVTVASVTVSSVTVTSNQPNANSAEAVDDPQSDSKPVRRSDTTSPPPLRTEPFLDPEAQTDPADRFTPGATAKKRRPRTRNWANSLPFIVLAGLVLLTLAILTRQEIIKLFPASAKLFNLLGLS